VTKVVTRRYFSSIEAVAEAIAHALYYIEKGRSWPGTFDIFCTFHSRHSLQGLPDGTEKLGKWYASRPYEDRLSLHVDVFQHKIHESSSELVFAMCFYGRIWVYARRTGRVLTSAAPVLVRP